MVMSFVRDSQHLLSGDDCCFILTLLFEHGKHEKEDVGVLVIAMMGETPEKCRLRIAERNDRKLHDRYFKRLTCRKMVNTTL